MEGAVWLSWLLCYTEDFTLVLISQLLNERRWCVICMYSKLIEERCHLAVAVIFCFSGFPRQIELF